MRSHWVNNNSTYIFKEWKKYKNIGKMASNRPVIILNNYLGVKIINNFLKVLKFKLKGKTLKFKRLSKLLFTFKFGITHSICS
jgi:hypothetical protein